MKPFFFNPISRQSMVNWLKVTPTIPVEDDTPAQMTLTYVGDPATELPYRNVILVMGQSNPDGRADVSGLPSDIENPTSKIQIFNSGGWRDWNCSTPPVTEKDLGAFAPDTVAFQRLSNEIGEPIYVVKRARGGTGFKLQESTNGNWNVAEPASLFQEFKSRYEYTKLYLEVIKKERINVVGMWMDIGATDSNLSDYATFKIDCPAFIQGVRDFTGKPNLPVLHRERGVTQGGGNNEWLIQAQNEFAAGEIHNYELLPFDTDWTFLSDGAHFDANGIDLYANACLPTFRTWYANPFSGD